MHEELGIYPLASANLSFEKETIVAKNETEVENITILDANLGIGSP